MPDADDAFPLDATESVDTDGEGIGNDADTDDDNDGLPDEIDPFPTNADANGDGIPDGSQPGRMRGNGSIAGGAKRDDFTFDVVEGVRRRGTYSGQGKFNGKSGYTFEATATDQGEPGVRRDTFSLVVKDAHGVVVFSESGELSRGNIGSLRLQPERDDHGRNGRGR